MKLPPDLELTEPLLGNLILWLWYVLNLIKYYHVPLLNTVDNPFPVDKPRHTGRFNFQKED